MLGTVCRELSAVERVVVIGHSSCFPSISVFLVLVGILKVMIRNGCPGEESAGGVLVALYFRSVVRALC